MRNICVTFLPNHRYPQALHGAKTPIDDAASGLMPCIRPSPSSAKAILTAVIFPALVCAYVRCVVLCVRCTPELQAHPANAPACWKPWARVFLFTLLPLRRTPRPRDVPNSIYAPHAYHYAVRSARMALQRLGQLG